MTTESLFAASAQPQARDLVIGALEPLSTTDWPGRLSATVFVQGCPWRCTYCHSVELQSPRIPARVSWPQVVTMLSTQRDRVNAVVFSGGEPTRQAALVPAINEVRQWGYAVGLHTAGAFPARLDRVLSLVDWVGFDIKATPYEYGAITSIAAAGERAWSSLDLVKRSGVECEVRVTVDPTIHSRDSILDLVDQLAARGFHNPVLQEARPEGTTPEYAQALAGRTLADVLLPEDCPYLTRR